MIARASHTHAPYWDGNSEFYFNLEIATQGTPYATSTKPFQQDKDAHGAWIALTSQYAGNDKWEVEVERQEQLLHTCILTEKCP